MNPFQAPGMFVNNNIKPVQGFGPGTTYEPWSPREETEQSFIDFSQLYRLNESKKKYKRYGWNISLLLVLAFCVVTVQLSKMSTKFIIASLHKAIAC